MLIQHNVDILHFNKVSFKDYEKIWKVMIHFGIIFFVIYKG